MAYRKDRFRTFYMPYQNITFLISYSVYKLLYICTFDKVPLKFFIFSVSLSDCDISIYNPQIEMFARFKTKSSFHKTKRII